MIEENAASSNSTVGIQGSIGSVIRHNTSNSNGGDGIQAAYASNVRGNAARGNDGYALNFVLGLNGAAAYAENVLSSTGGGTGTVGGTGGPGTVLQTGTNLCNTNTTFP